MAIDTRYLMCPSLQQYFVDKDTGFPLAAGEIRFFEDNNRSQAKSVYKLSGSPPDYIFVPIGNVITLSSVGTMQDDLGNDFIPYLLPEDNEGDFQLYYVEIYSAGGPSTGVLQFTREAWPPEAVTGSPSPTQDSTLNLIPNGQFALHNNIPENIVSGTPIGRITSPITDIASGGWTFERPSTSLSTDSVTFNRLPAFTDNPTASPRFEVLIQSNGGSPSDTFKDLRKKFNDVNKFASNEQKYTVFFSSRSITGGNIPLELNIIKNYGTGGTAQEIINIADFTITATQQDFSVSFTWGSNVGKLIGPLNDDFCQLAFSLPTDNAFSIAMTDFADLIGEVTINQFPISTDEDFIARSLIPPIPGFNAETYGLPLISTSKGLDYDYSQVGAIYPSARLSPPPWSVLCNGATIRTDGFFSGGVPCSRLRSVFTDNSVTTLSTPFFGTGSLYATAYKLSQIADGPFIISSNSPGTSAQISDGAVATGFSFIRVATGVATSAIYNVEAFPCKQFNTFWIQSILAGVTISSGSSGSSGISMSGNLQSLAFPYCDVNDGERYGTSTVKMLLRAIVTSLPAASSYVRIRLPASVNDVVFWFNVNGSGSQPVVPGVNTYVQINITSFFSVANDIAYVLSRAFSGAEIGYVFPIPGSSIPPNSYFNFFVGTQQYYVWYSLNNSGTDPNISGAIGIKVAYSAANTIEQISINTSTAINRMYYAIPDLRGWNIKGLDQNGLIDLRSQIRYFRDGNKQSITAPSIVTPGSYQFESQLGNVVSNSGISPPPSSPLIYPTYPLPGGRNYYPDLTTSNNYAGTSQLDTKNVYFNYFIKY